MNNATPFMFDVDFSKQELKRKEVKVEEAPPPPMFSEAELSAARQQAFEEGQAAGLAEAANSIEEKISQNIDVIVAALSQLASEQHRANTLISKQSILVARKLVEKLMPEMVRQHGSDEIEAVVTDTLDTMLDAAKVTVFVHPDLLSDMSERFKHIAATTNLNENLIVQADERLGPSDCRMEWGGGNAARHADSTWRELAGAVDRNVSVPLTGAEDFSEEPTKQPPEQNIDLTPQPAEEFAAGEPASNEAPVDPNAAEVVAHEGDDNIAAEITTDSETIQSQAGGATDVESEETEHQDDPDSTSVAELDNTPELPPLPMNEPPPLPGAVYQEASGPTPAAESEGDVLPPEQEEEAAMAAAPVLPGAIELDQEPDREGGNST